MLSGIFCAKMIRHFGLQSERALERP